MFLLSYRDCFSDEEPISAHQTLVGAREAAQGCEAQAAETDARRARKLRWKAESAERQSAPDADGGKYRIYKMEAPK